MNSCLILSAFLFVGISVLRSAQGDDCFKKPLGVSDPTKIPDNQLTASSHLNYETRAAHGRLNESRSTLGWCAKEAEKDDDWLQVDFGKVYLVCGVATHRHPIHTFTTHFKLSYSSGGNVWTTYKNADGTEKVFERSNSTDGTVHWKLPVSLAARYVRFIPIKQFHWNCLRVEVYGDKYDCATLSDGDQAFNEDISIPAMKWFETPSVVQYRSDCTGEKAFGMESGAIKNQNITAFSQWDVDHGPENARLNHVADGRKKGAWSAETNDANQWLQVDFGRNVKITKFQTQGRQDSDQWVKTYTLSFSEENGQTYQTYQENNVDKVFDGNTNRNSIITHTLVQPITARFVRIHPKSWHYHISMRAEFFGCVLSDRYKVTGRIVHMKYVKEHLETKKNVNFEENQERPNNIELEVLAETVYIEGDIKMHGMKKLTVFSRRVLSKSESQLDLSAPTLTQTFRNQQYGDDGYGGKQGVPGPKVEIFAGILRGYLNILTNGGNGNKGQNGREGRKGVDQGYQEKAKTRDDCVRAGNYDSGSLACPDVPGEPGIEGRSGQNGGYAGKSGDGGNAGQVTLHVKRLKGNMVIKSCRGKGAAAASNGIGGEGGLGSTGGQGADCEKKYVCRDQKCWMKTYHCYMDSLTSAVADGQPGSPGEDGKTPNTPGTDGQVESDYIQKLKLTEEALNKYPLLLLKLMKERADDLIWANNTDLGGKTLAFISLVTENRADASKLRKAAQRRLGFLNKEGFDRFGRNKMFAPLKKCSAFKKEVESVQDTAQYFQGAYNDVQDEINRQDDLKKVIRALPQTASAQVRSQKQRLEEAREISMKEKGLYVTGVTELEGQMRNFLTQILTILPDVYEKAQFNTGDLIAVLQGITGFVKGIAGKDPFQLIETSLNVAGTFATKCNTGSFKDVKEKVLKWLKFGKAYEALEDSNDLDFDTMDIASVPEMMKADLEMNKEGLAADLVCMLDERGLPRDTAPLKKLIESFFIAGAARIDLIAKIIDIDNDIGGFNFDINNLEETANAIESLTSTPDAPIAENIQQNFLDNLLQTYLQMEARFAKKLYYYYKSFEFQSLWDVDEKIAEYHKAASRATDGNGKLQGIAELQKAIAKIDELESSAQNCYTSFRVVTDIHKWSFDNSSDKTLFDELYKGQTRFTLDMPANSSMYNIRLLKMYVELFNDKDPSEVQGIPSKVYLRLRHLSASYFTDGNGNLTQFWQKLVKKRTFYFDRFQITDTAKCNEGKRKGEKNPIYCMEKSDDRLASMCCHYLSNLNCEQEVQLGAEECKSLYGTYELSIPIDDTLECTDSRERNKNCKDFQRSMFTKMNVWAVYLYWSDGYPKGPNDNCSAKDKPSKFKDLRSKRVPLLKHKPRKA